MEWSWFRAYDDGCLLETSLRLLDGARAVTMNYRLSVRDRYSSNSQMPLPYDGEGGNPTVIAGNAVFRTLQDIFVPPEKQKKIAILVCIEILKVYPVIPTPVSSLASDILEAIEDNEEFQDITLMVGSEGTREEIKANKFMLMARSPVFAGMFRSNMVEEKTSTIKIIDIEPDVFKVVLSFLYTGEVKQDLSSLSLIKQVLVAADKYAIDRLRTLCENLLINYITDESAASLLVFADRYCGDTFREVVIGYIVSDNDRCRTILESEGWQEVREEGGVKLVEEILRYHVGVFELPPAKRRRKSL